ncbi:MAG: helix-turn-helix domain-containing protein [Treponema sp.]|nr:helix-turn-helix domain-containing protein [Treponema sp.]
MKNQIKLIKTEKDYEEALKLADKLFDAEPDTPEGDILELIVTLIEIYEKEHYPIDNPSPLAAIKFRMEQLNLTQKDLIPIIGSKSKVSEVLSGKRTLSLNMIRKLSSELDIPAEVLIQPYDAIA